MTMKIGVRIHNLRTDAQSGEVVSYAEIRDLAQLAEAEGLDSVWLSDHLMYRFDPAVTTGPWESWTVLAALAEATERVELGTIVLCTPFRNPALLAKMAHTLDEVSGGRLILGVGAGWHQPEFEAFGYPFERRVDRLEEAVQILKPLLAGRHVDFAGKYYQVRDCLITPLGPRPDGIPLLIGAFGPRMLRLTARYADQWNTAWLGDPRELAARLESMHNACAEEGRDPGSIDVTVGVSVSFPDLGTVQPFASQPLTGSISVLAEAFRLYADAGAAHLILQTTPQTVPALNRVIDAVRLYRCEVGL
jgi:probable F420-dependent oxidoreductase